MAWMCLRVKARSLSLGTFTGGFQGFLDELARQLAAKGAVFHMNTPVSAIGEQDGKPTLTVNGGVQAFDRILATTSPGPLPAGPGAARNALRPERRRTADDWRGLRGAGYKEQLLTDGTYWLNPPATSPNKRESRFPFLALVEHTNWMERAHYNGDRILYLGDYVPADHAVLQHDG